MLQSAVVSGPAVGKLAAEAAGRCRLLPAERHTLSAATIALLGELVRERPTDPQLRYSLAKILAAEGRTAEARQHFQFVAEAQQGMHEVQKLTDRLQARPTDAELRYRIGSLLMKYDEPAHGAAWLRSVIDLAPDHHAAHAALADYHAATGNPALADEHRRLAQHLGESP